MNVIGWILGGALAASCLLNVVLWSKHRNVELAAVQAPLRIENLQLSDEQIRLLSNCCRECGCMDPELVDRVRTKEAELAAALAAEPTDESAVARLVAEVSELRGEVFERCVDAIVRVRSVLDERQRDVLGACCGDSQSK